MWANTRHARNLFRTSQSARLASIARSLDKSMLSAQRVPTSPTDIIRCSRELSDLRTTNGERTRQIKLGELKHLKRSRRYASEVSGQVYGRAEAAETRAVWDKWDRKLATPSPSDITSWVPLHQGPNPFVDS